MSRKKSQRKRSRVTVNKRMLDLEVVRRSFLKFARSVKPHLELTNFHRSYYEILEKFARGEIRKLIITVPPQHGKSLGASVLLPAYVLGFDPNRKICISSYSASLARTFGAEIQRVIDSKKYMDMFPRTLLKGMEGANTSAMRRTVDEFDICAAEGGLKLVGRGGSLTGSRVDVLIMDDLYKDAAEANSPIIREGAWDWYAAVAKTRLHNDSQELMVFTRWHEDDLIGRISKVDRIIEPKSMQNIEEADKESWVKINFEAIKKSPPTELDPRQEGEPLWAERHSLKNLNQRRMLDAEVFDALYQGNPMSRHGLLYREFRTYDNIDAAWKIRNYTDTADMGNDLLCSVCYAVSGEGVIYVVDVVYSSDPMEVTELMVADMLKRWEVESALVESNSGGRGFARVLQRLVPACRVESFHQTANKESRILTNASTVMNRILMPADWKERWGEFAEELTKFRKQFKANRHDDAADVLTGIVEREILRQGDDVRGKDAENKKIRAIGFG